MTVPGVISTASLPPFLIPATTTDTDEYLYCFVVDMPVVTAARLEGNFYNTTANVSQKTLTDEILAVRVRFAFRPFAAQGIPLAVEPGTEFINQFLTIAHVHGSLLVGSQLWNNTFETTQGSNGHLLRII